MIVSRTRAFAAAVAVGLLAAIGTVSLVSAQQSPLTVQIGAGREESSATGTVTLTAVGNQTRIDVDVAGTNPSMPGHVHADTCPGAGAVVFPLQPTVNGKSSTTVDAPLSDVLAKGKSINFHKSQAEVNIYTGCGNLVAGANAGAAQPTTLPRTGDLGSIAPLAASAGAVLAGAGLLLRRRR